MRPLSSLLLAPIEMNLCSIPDLNRRRSTRFSCVGSSHPDELAKTCLSLGLLCIHHMAHSLWCKDFRQGVLTADVKKPCWVNWRSNADEGWWLHHMWLEGSGPINLTTSRAEQCGVWLYHTGRLYHTGWLYHMIVPHGDDSYDHTGSRIWSEVTPVTLLHLTSVQVLHCCKAPQCVLTSQVQVCASQVQVCASVCKCVLASHHRRAISNHESGLRGHRPVQLGPESHR